MADTDQVLKLAAIIREVDGDHSKGAAALAELILDHPSFHQCCNEPAPPADGEVAELVETLKGVAYWKRHGKPGEPAPASFDIRQADRLTRAAEQLQRQAPQPPADGEVVEVVEWLREQLHVCLQAPWTPGIKYFGRAAELLERQATACAICERERLHQSTRAADLEVERQAAPVPVPVNERLPEPEDCYAEGRCWWFCFECPGEHSYWILAKEVYCNPTYWLPAHALPLPEVNNG